MVESVDTRDLKSLALMSVRVQVSLRAPLITSVRLSLITSSILPPKIYSKNSIYFKLFITIFSCAYRMNLIFSSPAGNTLTD